MRNKFIVFEGIEACGKSTQISLLKEFLKSKGEKVYTTAEPSDSKIGRLLRNYLKDGITNSKAASLLFAADRAIHEKVIRDYLKQGYWVICDRYIDSTLAYQDFLNLEEYNRSVNKDFIKPDITIYLRLSVASSLQRIASRHGIPECFDREDVLKIISSNYDKIYDFSSNNNTITINAENSVQQVYNEIISKLNLD